MTIVEIGGKSLSEGSYGRWVYIMLKLGQDKVHVNPLCSNGFCYQAESLFVHFFFFETERRNFLVIIKINAH